MPTRCCALLVRLNGKIVPTVGERDDFGGVSIKAPIVGTWPTRAEDWGEYDYSAKIAGKWGSIKFTNETLPAVVVYEAHTEPASRGASPVARLKQAPVPVAKPEDRLRHPAVLALYLQAQFASLLSRAAAQSRKEDGESFLSKIPRWAWWVGGLGFLIMVTLGNGSDFLGGILERLK